MRSTMRQLKPHSLSYQLTTLAHSPPSMSVSGASTIDECGLCMKSEETSSSWLTARMPRSARPAEILVRQVLELLVRGVGVDRGHHPALDAERVVQHFRQGHEAVGRAA